MRIGRYKIYYQGCLVAKVWTLNKAYELISNMTTCGYTREDFTIDYLEAGFSL